MISLKDKIGPQTAVILTLTMIGLILLVLNLVMPKPGPTATAVAAKLAPEVSKIERVEVAPKTVKALPHKAKQKLALPEPVASDPNIYALGANRIKPDLYPVTVTTTLDAETGEIQTYEKREPMPLLALPKRGEAGVAYGFKPDGGPVWRLYARQGLLDVKAMRVGVEATLDSDGDAFAGASLSYRW